MSKNWLNPTSFEDLIKRFNPFGFKKSNGETEAFKDYGDLYLFTMRHLAAQFPRGYIDMVLFLEARTQMPTDYLKRLVKTFKPLGLKYDVFLLEYWNEERGAKEGMERIMKCLHTISETNFNQSYFNKAWETFSYEMEQAERYERTINGSIIDNTKTNE